MRNRAFIRAPLVMATRGHRMTMGLVLGSSLWGCVGQPPPPPGVEDTEASGSITLTEGLSSSAGPDATLSTAGLDTSSSSAEADSTTGDVDPFIFPTDPYDAYTQIDRHGAVEAGTAGILASQGLGLAPGQDIALRDEYNASNPLVDANGLWLDEIIESVTFFHDSFDDDLMALGLTPAIADQAIQQAGPVIVPDAIKYDPTQPTRYPNGRALTDPVVDITLAAVLLDLGEHPLEFFAGLPLNPGENDVPFLDEFPYLAPAHPP